MASGVYGSFVLKGYNGSNLNLATGGNTIKVALVTSAYTFTPDTHDYFDDITNEVTGTGYTAGGATLGSQQWTLDTTDNEGVFDGADTSWTASVITAAAAILYIDTAGASSTDPLLCYVDFGGNKSSDGGTFQITWAAEGIINISY
jgi:hypothetical protein